MKRFLFVSTSDPARGSGTGERTLSILNALNRLGETHFMLLYAGGPELKPHSDPNRSVVRLFAPGEDTSWFWRRRKYLLKDFRPDPRIRAEVQRLHERHRFDAFVCRYFLTAVTGCDRLGPAVLDFDDVPDRMPGPPVPGWGTIGWQLTALRLRTFRSVLVTKRADTRKLRHPDIRVLPCVSTLQPHADNGAATDPTNLRMLFIGSMRWPPNRDGLTKFIERVLPNIRRRVPGAVLRVVGEDSKTWAGIDGVDPAGFVDDLAAEYRDAAMSVCPIRMGTGSNVKLAEAAQCGKAIVASPEAAAGFEGVLEPARDLLVAGSDDAFADMCVKLLTDVAARRALGAQAAATAAVELGQSAVDRVMADVIGR